MNEAPNKNASKVSKLASLGSNEELTQQHIGFATKTPLTPPVLFFFSKRMRKRPYFWATQSHRIPNEQRQLRPGPGRKAAAEPTARPCENGEKLMVLRCWSPGQLSTKRGWKIRSPFLWKTQSGLFDSCCLMDLNGICIVTLVSIVLASCKSNWTHSQNHQIHQPGAPDPARPFAAVESGEKEKAPSAAPLRSKQTGCLGEVSKRKSLLASSGESSESNLKRHQLLKQQKTIHSVT